MAKRRERSPSGSAPWTAKKKAELDRQPTNRPFIYLLVDVEGARLLAEGIIPEYVTEQCERALEWADDEPGTLPQLHES